MQELSFVRAAVWAVVILGSQATLPIRADEQTPLIAELSAPREVISGEDAEFVAAVEGGTRGTILFALKTYAGKTVWSKTAPIADGRASVLLASAEVAGLEKDSRVLVVEVNGKVLQSAYAPVRLRGRIFRDVTSAPDTMQPGDEIVITDMSLLRPRDATSHRSVKGKWWRRDYRIDGQDKQQALLYVAEHDPGDPESCLAGQITLPLKLEGWYEVWVRTYRQRPSGKDIGFSDPSGGIDVRLSGEKYFLHATPFGVNTNNKPAYPQARWGVLVDMRYRAADMTGQSLVFQQPYGTYESTQKKCNAVLAGVRLKKLSESQVARLKTKRASRDVRRIGYDNDGFSCFWRWGTHDEAAIARLLEPLRDQSTEFFNISLGGVGAIIVPTPYTDGIYQKHGRRPRDGDRRANAFFRWCFENDVNIVDVLARRAHEVDLKLFVSLMTERCMSADKIVQAHPEWRVKRGRGTWNYAIEGVQNFQVKKIAWICKNHAIDGFIVDFTRYGHHFNRDEPDKFKHMNAFLRKLRKAVDEVNASKDRKVRLCGSFGDLSWHLTQWGSGKLEDQGLDVKTWLAENIFDIIMPEGPTAVDYVAMAKNSRTQVWPRKTWGVDFREHKRVHEQEGAKESERGAKDWFDRGSPGIFFFNYDTRTTFGRLGFTDELALRAKVDEIYGMREGPKVSFTSR